MTYPSGLALTIVLAAFAADPNAAAPAAATNGAARPDAATATHQPDAATPLTGGGSLLGESADSSAARRLLSAAEYDFAEAQRLMEDAPHESRRLFLSAAQNFQAIEEAGFTSGALRYNIGNCYLLAGDIGRAVLWYKRAQRLTPGDPLLAENLSVARSRCLSPIRDTRASALKRTALFWHYSTAISTRITLGLVAYALAWLLLGVWRFRRQRPLAWTAGVAMLLAVATGGSAIVQHWMDRNRPAGVITELDVPVYNGPSQRSNRRFEQPLQPGVEFTLRERRGGWWWIELEGAESGWIAAGAAELVVES